MLGLSLLVGLASIFTPTVLFMIICLIVGFNNLKLKTKQYYLSVIGFGLIAFIMYIIFGYLIYNNSIDLITSNNTNIGFKTSLAILNIVFALLILGVIKIRNINRIIKHFITTLSIVIMGIVFSFSSFPSISPLLGTIMISNMNAETIFAIISPMIGFVLGLIIPICCILIFTAGLFQRISEKKWWNVVKIIIGSLYLVIVIIGLFLS